MMKVTKEQLKQIIKEELEEIMGEEDKHFINPNDPEAVMRDRYMRDELEKLRRRRKAREEESGEVKKEEQAVTEEQYFEILHRQDGFADAELLTTEEAEDRLDPKTEFTHTHHSKGRYIAKVVRIADLER